MKELKSEGKCVYCNETFGEREISRHLASHLRKSEEKEGKKRVLHLKVDGGDGMFLNILASDKALLEDVDDFLRAIWLECCGHLSGFSKMEEDASVVEAFSSNKKVIYDYDYGSTTRLEIKLIGSHFITQKEKIKLLSRNEPLKIMCSDCGKNPASEICIEHSWQGNDGFYCIDCAKKHEKICGDFADYAKMPVVNSPRMGVCGYMGGYIDKKRDGIYKEARPVGNN